MLGKKGSFLFRLNLSHGETGRAGKGSEPRHLAGRIECLLVAAMGNAGEEKRGVFGAFFLIYFPGALV
jgi:hypothetical protein